MRTLIRIRRGAPLVACLALLGGAIGPADVEAICCPIPCDDCWLTSQGQLNLVVMDRDRGQVRLVPNVSFQGLARDFALVVPTPSLPEFGLVDSAIWEEARQLTAPVRSTRSRGPGGFGCEDTFSPVAPPSPSSTEDGVFIHVETTVGAFHATVISSDDPNALVTWLSERGFALRSEDAARFAPYVARRWFFTAMRPDTSNASGRMPPRGWNADVKPVLITYAAQEFEIPLPIIGINRAPRLPVVLYVVDDHRMALEGFTTEYANRLSRGEHEAIARQHPHLAAFLAPGRTLTRLTRTFAESSPMDRSILLERAPNDDEFRRVTGR